MRVTEPYTIFPRTLKSGKVVYYYQFRTEDGLRTTAKSTGCTTLSQAKRFCNKLYNSGEFEKKSTTRFEVYSKDFFEKDKPYYKWKIVSKQKITDNTLLRYKQLLGYQLLPYFKDYQISKITRNNIKEWIIWASEKWSDKTVNNAQTVLNLILNQAVEQDIIKFNPAVNLSFRKTEKKDRDLLTIFELKEILKKENWKNLLHRKAILVAVCTGMRIGEVVALQNEDIYDNYIKVTHNWVKKFGLSDCKTHTKRFVPIIKSIKNILHNNTSNWIFPNENNVPLNISRLHDDLVSIYKKLNIDYKSRCLTTHTMRNFFISYLLSENVTEQKEKAVVGHKDSSMTGLYTYWKPEMFKEVYEAQQKLYNQIIGREDV